MSCDACHNILSPVFNNCVVKFWIAGKQRGSAKSEVMQYCHFRPSLNREEFCRKFYFSNVNGLSGRVSLLTNKTLAVML